MVNRIDPKLGESIMDPACGTGGFLACSFDHVKDKYVKNITTDLPILQKQIHGVEKKQLPHLLCTTNMLLHGIEVPVQIKHGNTLSKPLSSWDEQLDIIVTNPPFGGTEEDGIEKNFPAEFRSRETADLFLQLIIEILKDGGRAAVVLPDGTLFGDGIKAKIKKLLTEECNLHTIVRLPNGVFAPYTGIKTNILFFTKGQPTENIWYYEHPYPAGVKSYNKTKPMKFEEFQTEIDWWGAEADGFASRVENEQAWKIDFKAKREDAETRAKPYWDKSIQLKNEVSQKKQDLVLVKETLKDKNSDNEVINLQIKKLTEEIDSKQQEAGRQQKTGDDIFFAIFNFDIKNPHVGELISHDPEELLSNYSKQQTDIQALRDQLKGILANALAGNE
jgi:type I restriction enzyme M protein